MIIEILKDILENDSNDNDLDKLWFIIEGQHRLLIKTDEDIEVLFESSWYNSLKGSIKEVIHGLIIWALENPTLTSRISISNQNYEYFTIKEAAKFLKQPFMIILENSNNDAPFFETLLIHFPKQGKKIKKYKDEHWLKYVLGGGTTVMDVIKGEMKHFNDSIFTKEKHKYLRCFVLLDSDKEYPNMELKPDKINLIKFLEENEIGYHILEKREMENYLPDEAFEEIEDNREFIEAYLLMNPIQKDYFDLEKGFPSKRFDQLPNEFQMIYSDLSEQDKDTFRNNDLLKLNSSDKVNFKSYFPTLFLSENVTKENLLKRCAHHTNNPKESPYNPLELPKLLLEISVLL